MSKNASQLFARPVDRAGRALAGYRYSKGNTQIYNQGEHFNDYTIFSEAYFRLSPAIMLYGQASFSSANEKNVVGSAFLNPQEMPFDITFMDHENVGDRKKETYNILGAVGYRITNKWAIGAKFDYTAINMARTKDLRHINKVLDLDASGGATYMLSDKVTSGAHDMYNLSIDGVTVTICVTAEQRLVPCSNL